MRKRLILKRTTTLILTIAILLSMAVTPVFALGQINSADGGRYASTEGVSVGETIIGFDGEAEIVIEVNENGSFKTMKITASTYAASACQHYNLRQISSAIYRGNRYINTVRVCYQKVYSALYECTSCKTRRQITTYIDVAHTYNNGICSLCKRVK